MDYSNKYKIISELHILSEINFGYIGDYPVAGMGEPWSMKIGETQDILKKHGIGAILTLTEEDMYGPKHMTAGFKTCHVPIDDCEAPTMKAMENAIEFIDVSVETGLKVAVHCFEGRGRTGTVLCGWVGLKESLTGEKAIKRIYELRPCSVITPPQRKFLCEFLG